MADTVLTLVNNCDDDHEAKLVVYRSRSAGDDSTPAAWTEVELPSGATRELTVPDGAQCFVGVESVGPGGLHPGRGDALSVPEGAQTVVVTGSLATGLRVALS